MQILFFGKSLIRDQFSSLFPEYDSWETGLDATRMSPGNNVDISLKMSQFHHLGFINEVQMDSKLYFKHDLNCCATKRD